MRKYLNFKVKSSIFPYYFWVRIYKDFNSFNYFINHYLLKFSQQTLEEKVGGCFFPYKIIKITKNKEEEKKDLGIVCFYKQNLKPSVVYHEILHVVFNIYRRTYKKIYFGKDINEKEERFIKCYIDLLRKTIDKLYKLKLW